MITQRIRDVLRRHRTARYRRREAVRDLRDERQSDHLERAREGIKDTPPQQGPC
jgi:hypothetical protein